MDLSSCFHLCRLHFGTCHQEFFRAHVIVKGRNGQCCSQASLFFLSEREMWDSSSTDLGKTSPPPPPRQGIPLVFSTRISRRTVKVLEALLALPYFSRRPLPPLFASLFEVTHIYQLLATRSTSQVRCIFGA